MKGLVRLLICFGFLLSVQLAYSHPLQTDHKAGITNVMPTVYMLPSGILFQPTTVAVVTYVVQPVDVIMLAQLQRASQIAVLLTNKQLSNRINEITNYSSLNLPRIRHVEKCQTNYINQYNAVNQLNANNHNPFS